MDLHTYLSNVDRRNALAAHLACSPGYLWQIAQAWRGRRASAELARKIHQATLELGGDVVPLHAIRPDLWDDQAVAKQGR